jgi:hypothetical protein
MDRVNRNPTAISRSIKYKRSRMLAIGVMTFVGICALAALAIALYFLINNMKTTSLTTSTPGKHFFDLQSRAMEPKDFAKNGSLKIDFLK